MINLEQTSKQCDRQFKSVGGLFKIISIVNLIVIFIAFWWSKIDLWSTLCFLCLIYGSVYVREPTAVVGFEFSVIFISFVILFKACYVIIVDIIFIEIKGRADTRNFFIFIVVLFIFRLLLFLFFSRQCHL